MKALLLSAYAAGSHISWRERVIEMFPQWEWEVLELPPRYFSWRVRGNALYWSLERRQQLLGNFQLLLATSMVDLATLRGLVPELGTIPTALYFHENQFEYPAGRGQHGPLEAQVVSLYSALAADQLLFNSHYNRRGFLDGCRELLRRMPDKVPGGIPDVLAAKASVLPVPVDIEQLASGVAAWPGGEAADRPRLVWLGRFEYDKGVERLLALLRRLEARDFSYELAVVGQQFREVPAAFETIAQEFGHRLVHFGYVQRASDYRALLRGADIVLSTALHEFQGIAVMEAVAAGCLPVVPDRLAYPEIYPSRCRYESSLEDPDRESTAACHAVMQTWRERQAHGLQAPDLTSFSPHELAPQYRNVLAKLATSAG